MASFFQSFLLLLLFLAQKEFATNITISTTTIKLSSTHVYTSSPTYEPTKPPTPKPTAIPTYKPTHAPTIYLNSSQGINIVCYVSMAGLETTDVKSQETFFILAFTGATNIESTNFSQTTTIDSVIDSACTPMLDGISIKFDVVTFDPLVLNAISSSFENGNFQSTFENSVSYVYSDATICYNTTNYTYSRESSNVLVTPAPTQSIGQKIDHEIQFLVFGLVLMIASLIWLFLMRVKDRELTYAAISQKSEQVYVYSAIGILTASTKVKSENTLITKNIDGNTYVSTGNSSTAYQE